MRPLEVGGLLASVVVFVPLAALFLMWLGEARPFPMLSLSSGGWRRAFDPDRPLWQALLAVWLFGLGLLTAGALLGYLRWNRAGPEEALLHLQDQLWHQTRREQRRAERLWARARLRAERRKERA